MKAAELYQTLHTSLGRPLAELGFKKQRSSRLTYQRKVGDIYRSVWFQTDKWGWDKQAGSSFFVNFTITDKPDPESSRRRWERLNFFLTEEELERARALRNAIVGRIPKPPESYFHDLELEFRKHTPQSAGGMIETLRAQFEPETRPYRRGHDLSLRYWQPRDVSEWAEFITPVLPRAIEQLETWWLPR